MDNAPSHPSHIPAFGIPRKGLPRETPARFSEQSLRRYCKQDSRLGGRLDGRETEPHEHAPLAQPLRGRDERYLSDVSRSEPNELRCWMVEHRSLGCRSTSFLQAFGPRGPMTIHDEA